MQCFGWCFEWLVELYGQYVVCGVCGEQWFYQFNVVYGKVCSVVFVKICWKGVCIVVQQVVVVFFVVVFEQCVGQVVLLVLCCLYDVVFEFGNVYVGYVVWLCVYGDMDVCEY